MSNYLIPGEVRCWSCGKWMSNNELENADGCCPFCDEEICTNEPPYTSDSEQGGPMNDITALTPEKLAEIRQRYSPVAAPKCHICGAEMTIGAASASRIVYACSGATYDDAGCHYAPGRSIADDHYAQSRVTVVDVSDPDVLALVEALEAKQPHHNGMMQLSNELVMAKQRIAELESRTVTVNPYPLATDKSQGWTIHPDFLHQIGERISDDEENYDSRPSMEMVEAVLLAAGGINAEGQAGTVTVKLPKRYSCEGYHIDEAYLQEDPEGDCYDRDEVLEALAAAGIQVIEGEQKNG